MNVQHCPSPTVAPSGYAVAAETIDELLRPDTSAEAESGEPPISNPLSTRTALTDAVNPRPRSKHFRPVAGATTVARAPRKMLDREIMPPLCHCRNMYRHIRPSP